MESRWIDIRTTWQTPWQSNLSCWASPSILVLAVTVGSADLPITTGKFTSFSWRVKQEANWQFHTATETAWRDTIERKFPLETIPEIIRQLYPNTGAPKIPTANDEAAWKIRGYGKHLPVVSQPVPCPAAAINKIDQLWPYIFPVAI